MSADRDIIEALEEFTRNLKEGVPVEAVEVRREETPDGPMHTQRRVVLNAGRKPKPPGLPDPRNKGPQIIPN